MKLQQIVIIIQIIMNQCFIHKVPLFYRVWPIWVQKNGFRKKCNKDSDCNFPSACCHHPIIPGDKFCCTGGYKKRELVKAYIYQPVQSTFLLR